MKSYTLIAQIDWVLTFLLKTLIAIGIFGIIYFTLSIKSNIEMGDKAETYIEQGRQEIIQQAIELKFGMRINNKFKWNNPETHTKGSKKTESQTQTRIHKNLLDGMEL